MVDSGLTHNLRLTKLITRLERVGHVLPIALFSRLFIRSFIKVQRLISLPTLLTSTLMAPAVPKEIVDAIIEELSDCSNALSACSLVSRSFLDASRRTFLSRRAISIQPTAQKINQLTAFLSAPHNSCYVYDLRIHYRHRDDDWWATTLPPLLIGLGNLRSISICEYGEGGTINWERVSPAVQTALINTFSSTSLTNIRLYGLANFPATHFAGLSQLQTLVCADCDFKIEWESLLLEGPRPHVQGNLYSLQVYNPRSAASLNALVKVLEHQQSALGISQLRELLVYGQAFHLTDSLREVMKASSESLETFTWWLEAPRSEDPIPRLSKSLAFPPIRNMPLPCNNVKIRSTSRQCEICVQFILPLIIPNFTNTIHCYGWLMS